MMIGAVFLDPLAASVVNTDHDQFPYSGLGKIPQMPVDGPAPERGFFIKEILGILEIKDRIGPCGIIIIMGKQSPDPPLFPKLRYLKILVDKLDDRIMRLSLSEL